MGRVFLLMTQLGFEEEMGFFVREKENLLDCLRKQHNVVVPCGKIKDNNPQTPTLILIV